MIWTFILWVLFDLEVAACFVLCMTNTVQLIVYESAGVGGTIGESHLATTSPLIVCPLALIDVSVKVVEFPLAICLIV